MLKLFCCVLVFTSSAFGVSGNVDDFTEGWIKRTTKDLNGSVNTIGVSAAVDSSVIFYYYTQSTINKPVVLNPNGVFDSAQVDIDFTKKTLIVIHGWTDDINSDVIQGIKKAALANEDINVIGTDWGAIAKNDDYLTVVAQVKPVGQYVGDFLKYLVGQNMSTAQLHLVGHSLGAHVVGFAGKRLKIYGYKAARITGLDAALPGFLDKDDKTTRLAKTDAAFVDCIHTTVGLLGYDISIGNADFYPNGGVFPQPGCSVVDFGACSHGRSHEYFAESFYPSQDFAAMSCKLVTLGLGFDCESKGASMGYYADPTYTGDFYLMTNSASPYSKSV